MKWWLRFGLRMGVKELAGSGGCVESIWVLRQRWLALMQSFTISSKSSNSIQWFNAISDECNCVRSSAKSSWLSFVWKSYKGATLAGQELGNERGVRNIQTLKTKLEPEPTSFLIRPISVRTLVVR